MIAGIAGLIVATLLALFGVWCLDPRVDPVDRLGGVLSLGAAIVIAIHSFDLITQWVFQ